jgi:urease accessory protein
MTIAIATTIVTNMSHSALSRLLQIASPMLPIGAYSYSQGLEWAIESEDVTDISSAQDWIGDVLTIYFGQFELPILYRLYQAWQAGDVVAIREWDSQYKAGRDSAETLAESKQMSYSLMRLHQELDSWSATSWQVLNDIEQPSFLTVYALSAFEWGISAQDTLHAYAWSWLENQASAAMKTVPLGQVAGQKIISALAATIEPVIAQAMALQDDEISNFCPMLTLASCQHETQYSRLFRS